MRCERNPITFNQEKRGNVMKKFVTVVWQVLTCGQNGGDARPNPGQAYTLTRPSATLTRSRPLARPDGPSTGRIPSAASQAAEVSHPVGEGQEGGIVPRFLEDAGDGMSRTVNRQTSDGLWSSPLLGERVPEPPEWGAISALGLMGICGLREWRQRRCGERLKSCPVK